MQCVPRVTLSVSPVSLAGYPVTHAYIPYTYIYIHTHMNTHMSNVYTWEFPKIGVPYFGVLITRILLFGVLYWGPLLSETPTSICGCGPRLRSGSGSTSGFGAASAIKRRGPA